MTIGATAGALAASMAPSGLPGTGSFAPSYGLAFRFSVVVDDLNLGAWQSCSGLKVEFKSEPRKAGGQYAGHSYLPVETSWSKIVLKRAVAPSDSSLVQEWLQTHGHDWVGGKQVPGVGARITLFNAEAQPVMHWVLRGVRPAAWSGPDLDAGSSKVAIETLELVHEGFTVGKGAAPAAQKETPPTRAKLTLSGPTGSPIEFEYPPEKIEFKVANKPGTTARNVAGENTEGASTGVEYDTVVPGKATYVLSNLVIQHAPSGSASPGAAPTAAGENRVQQQVKQLQEWSVSLYQDAKNFQDYLPRLTFSWSGGFHAEVQLVRLGVSFTRFDEGGRPTRAVIQLELDTVFGPPKPPPPQPPPPPPAPRLVKSDKPSEFTRQIQAQGQSLKPTAGNPAGGGGGKSPKRFPREGAKNPTSGGVEGRSTVLMRSSDTLPSLALSCYGNAVLWREIAEANGVDDPLRVRPGAILYVPAPGEVGR